MPTRFFFPYDSEPQVTEHINLLCVESVTDNRKTLDHAFVTLHLTSGRTIKITDDTTYTALFQALEELDARCEE